MKITANDHLAWPLYHYVRQKLYLKKDAGFIDQEILARIAHASLIPFSFATSILDTIVGSISGGITIASGGTSDRAYSYAQNFLKESQPILAFPFLNALRTLNPHANILRNRTIQEISSNGPGLLTAYIKEKLREKIYDLHSGHHLLTRQVTSRLCHAVFALACVITRIVDFAVGSIAAILSFLTYGEFATINHLAYRGLKVGGVFLDVFQHIIEVINPLQEEVPCVSPKPLPA